MVPASDTFSLAKSFTYTNAECWPGLDLGEDHRQSTALCGGGLYPSSVLITGVSGHSLVITSLMLSYNRDTVPGSPELTGTFAESGSTSDLYMFVIGDYATLVEHESPIVVGSGKDFVFWRGAGPDASTSLNLNLSYYFLKD